MKFLLYKKTSIKRYFKTAIFALSLSFILFSCSDSDDNDKDMEKPVIESGDEFVPQNCDVYHKGDTIPFRYTMTDDVALGSFNIEIHNNFDHHTHSTDAGDCTLDPKKSPISPWVYNKDFQIPANQTLYKASVNIKIPDNIDSGDYHFMIRLTDASGWQQLKAVSIKIADKENS